MAIEKVREHLAQFGAQNRILEFETSSATVELAAVAAGVEPARIAKTLSFDVSGATVLVVCAGDVKVKSGKFKAYFGVKPKMLEFLTVEARVGHAVGGVCPFGVNPDVKVYLDNSLKRFETVFPACGSDNSAVELTCDELQEYSFALDWVDVCEVRKALASL